MRFQCQRCGRDDFEDGHRFVDHLENDHGAFTELLSWGSDSDE